MAEVYQILLDRLSGAAGGEMTLGPGGRRQQLPGGAGPQRLGGLLLRYLLAFAAGVLVQLAWVADILIVC